MFNALSFAELEALYSKLSDESQKYYSLCQYLERLYYDNAKVPVLVKHEAQMYRLMHKEIELLITYVLEAMLQVEL
jgi:hypothetical protein